MKYAWRLLENLESLTEMVRIWLMCWIGGFLIGLGWTWHEISDSWGRD